MVIFTNKYLLRFFSGLIANLTFFSIANCGDILFHEEVGAQAIIYTVSSEGTNLKKIGKGLFPQWSPDKNYISYVEYIERRDPTFARGLVVIEPSGKEIFRIGGKENPASIIRYSWHPNGKGIALLTVLGRHNGSIGYYDINTKQMRTLQEVEFKDLDMAFIATTLEWSHDGKQILFFSRSLLPKGMGVFLIDIKDGAIKNLSEEGILPRFVSGKVLFMTGSEVWTINLDGSDKKKIADIGVSVISSTTVSNNKIIFQVDAQKTGKEYPFLLYLLDLNKKELNLEEIKSKYMLLCPNISPDGNKLTAIGMRLKDEKGQFVSGEVANLGYYIFDLRTNAATLIKRFEDTKKDEGFWSGIYMGYGNHTNWN